MWTTWRVRVGMGFACRCARLVLLDLSEDVFLISTIFEFANLCIWAIPRKRTLVTKSISLYTSDLAEPISEFYSSFESALRALFKTSDTIC